MHVQYPPHTTGVYSYIESRGGKYEELVFFGLQAFIKEYLLTPITEADVDEAEEIWTAHGEPFNREGWMHIVKEYGGKLPVRIKAAPEGMPFATSNVMLTIENTDPKCFWLTTYLETALLRAVWYPTTVATNSREIKKIIAQYLKQTADNLDGLPFKLHDFGARGVSSNESATLGGMAHLVNFMGTDTIVATLGARRYYGAEMAGFSIPASEHSNITSWGRDNEVDAYRNMVQQFAKPGALYAVVSDSYDIYNAVEHLWGESLRDEVVNSGATLVVRPDSGTPWKVVRDTVELLDKKFGSTKNSKGYKVLNNVRVIQGDGINADSVRQILQALLVNGYSADNIAFGMGGALLGAPQRDDQKFAFKASMVQIDNEWHGIRKDPITDPGKKSKIGFLKLVKGDKSFKTISSYDDDYDKSEDYLRIVYEDGVLLIDDDFSIIRERASL